MKLDGKRDLLTLRCLQLDLQLHSHQVRPHIHLTKNMFVAQIVHHFVSATHSGHSNLNLIFASAYEPFCKFLQKNTISQNQRLKLAVDFLRGVLFFDQAQRYLKFSWDDLSVLDNRLVIFPLNTFVLLEDSEGLSEQKLKPACTDRSSFLRDCAYYFVSIIAGKTDMPLGYVVSNYKSEFPEQKGGEYNVNLMKLYIGILLGDSEAMMPASSIDEPKFACFVTNCVKSTPTDTGLEEPSSNPDSRRAR